MELGRSADGAHMALNWAGSGTVCGRNAAGPSYNAKCHIYHEDATVAKLMANALVSGKVSSLTIIMLLICISVNILTLLK